MVEPGKEGDDRPAGAPSGGGARAGNNRSPAVPRAAEETPGRARGGSSGTGKQRPPSGPQRGAEKRPSRPGGGPTQPSTRVGASALEAADAAGAPPVPQRPRFRVPGLDISPPAWLVRVIQPRPARFPWAEMARVLVAIAAPLGVGELAGQLSLSSIVAMGALAAALTDNGGPLEHRLRRTATAVVFGAIGMLVGRLLGGQAWLAVGAVAVLSLASAMMSVVSAIGSVAGLQLLVYFAIGGGSLVVVPPQTLLIGYLIGAVWGILCTVVRSLLEGRRRPEREAVAGVYQKIAELLAATGTPWMQQARRALTDAMNQAFDLLLDYRARSAGRDWAALRLATLLNAATPLVEATVAIAYDGDRPPPNLHGAAVAVADAIRANGPAPEIELGPAPSNPLLAAWRRADESVLASWDRYATPSAPPPLVARLRSALDQVVTGRDTWLYGLRLVLCMSLAETLHSVVPLARSYWVLLTVAIVLKPDFGSVFVRGLQRGLGTVIGVVIGFGMLLLLPDKLLIVLGIAVIAALLPYAILRNYGMFSTFLTPLVVLLIDLTSPIGRLSGVAAGEARLVDTLVGCAIVLVFGFLLWPETWRPRLGPRIADAAASVGDYLEAALFDPGRGRQLRRRTYRRLSDLRTAFQQTLAEPPPMSTRAAAWWPLIVQLESATDAITEAAIRARAGAPAPAPGAAAANVAALRELADALREGRPVRESASGAIDGDVDPALGRVTATIRTALRIVAGPVGSPRRRRGRWRLRRGARAPAPNRQ